MENNKSITAPCSLQLNSELNECDRLYRFLAGFGHTYKIGEETLQDLKLASEEIFANIVNHGYNKDTDRIINISISIQSDHIKLSFTDDAAVYDPIKGMDSATPKDPCDGNMGLQIIRSVTDTQSYERIDNHNVFIITKHYTTQK